MRGGSSKRLTGEKSHREAAVGRTFQMSSQHVQTLLRLDVLSQVEGLQGGQGSKRMARERRPRLAERTGTGVGTNASAPPRPHRSNPCPANAGLALD